MNEERIASAAAGLPGANKVAQLPARERAEAIRRLISESSELVGWSDLDDPDDVFDLTCKNLGLDPILVASDWPEMTTAVVEGMKAAADRPGRYGGRYVARTDAGAFVVLDDDDPEIYPEANIVAHCRADKVHGVGRARNYLEESGRVVFEK